MDTKGTTEQEGDQRSHGLGHQGESDVRVGIETGKAEPAGNKANQESELGKTEIAESNAMGHNARGTKTLGTEEVQGLERRETVKNEMEARKEGQEEMENSVAEDKSGTEEPKEEADGPGTPEEPKEGEGEAGTLGENISIPNREAETGCAGSTSDEPLSPDPGDEEEPWPEVSVSSPDEAPESPIEFKSLETGDTSSGTTVPETATGNTTSSETTPKGNQHVQPEEAAAAKEKKKRPTFDKRELTKPRMPPRTQGRKAIVEKFGGAASGPSPNIKRMGSANSVKNMLLEWCRAKTRDYEHVDIQNFSSSWSSGMAFCALIHKFFPDAFDYESLDPAKRAENFALAFTTAETHADCAQLLDVDDMIHMRVPDAKCIYTYIQELYRSLVQKGLVKTKKQ